ncbi:Fantastic Four domain [Dillenia turbinata]|uniref:Fantastic Four domain n=1 Tax=Dillenia turbinata TaxID=194707 RepID=A0AAN8YSW9_9MAGN
MMLSFCKKSVHSFLGFVNTCPKEFDSSSSSSPRRISRTSSFSPSNGLSSLIDSSNNDIQSSVNIVESVKAPFMTTTLSSSNSPNSYAKRDHPLGTFFDEVGGAIVDGVTSCTESLGFESSDERRVDDNDDIVNEMKNDKLLVCSTSPRSDSTSCTRLPATSSRTARMMNRVRSFPPPLSSFNRNGHPSFFLKPVRKDGRLELTEVRIERPEILSASRENGRLRLHLITNDDEDEDGDHENESEKLNTTFQEEEEEEEAIQEEEEEMRNDWWKTPVAGVAVGGGGEGLRRCHELWRT